MSLHTFLTQISIRASREVTHTNMKKDNNYLVKEAELIISNYIKDSRKHEILIKEPITKKLNTGNRNSLNMIINIVLIGSIALLIFIISKMI